MPSRIIIRQYLIPLLAGIAIGWQFVAVNGVSMAAALASFDPSSLLRFPLRFGRYLVLRLALGLLTPSTIIGCLALFAAAIGIAIADASLAPAAFVVLAIYAAMNIFFSRMIAVWLERWLSTRRAREIFGVLMAMFFISFQFLNYHGTDLTPSQRTPPATSWLLTFLHSTNRSLDWLPPGFAARSISLAAHPLAHMPALRAIRRAAGCGPRFLRRLRAPPAQAVPGRVPERRRTPRRRGRDSAHARAAQSPQSQLRWLSNPQPRCSPRPSPPACARSGSISAATAPRSSPCSRR